MVNGMQTRVTLTLTVVALMTVVLSPTTVRAEPEAIPPGRGFTFLGEGCLEPAVFVVPVDYQKADLWVPDPFVPRRNIQDAQSATLVVAVANCKGVQINDSPKVPGTLSDVGIEIEPPPGQDPGGHIYQLWQTTTIEALRAEMEHVGMFGTLVPGMKMEYPSPMQTTAKVPWEYSEYSLTVNAPEPTVPFPPGSNTWWHLGPRGFIRIAYDFLQVKASFGVGTVRAEAGSPLADLMGGTERAGLGQILLLDPYEGKIEIVKL